MKKILSLILVLAMTFSLSTTALAADSTTSSISENEAVELARWFIANDIYLIRNLQSNPLIQNARGIRHEKKQEIGLDKFTCSAYIHSCSICFLDFKISL